MESSKSLQVTLVSYFFIFLFTLVTATAISYGVVTVFASNSENASFWLKAALSLFSFFFPDGSFFIFAGTMISVAGIVVSFALLQRKPWARFLFVGVSVILFVWIAYRLFYNFTHIPPFVSIKAIFDNNPVTKYLSRLYFSTSFLMVIVEAVLAISTTVLLSKKASEDFKL